MKIFEHLFILGRPAAGKSEFIDFMKKLSDEERSETFHIGRFEEIDDFPWIWQACLDDDERERQGKPRLFTEKTDEGLNLTVPDFRSSQMPKFNDAIFKVHKERPNFFEVGTLLIEFARGKGDGFRVSLEKMDPKILNNSAILYIDVSFEESFRRNNARYDESAKGSILFHKVPDKDMEGYFKENDWKDITENRGEGLLNILGVDIPFVDMPNEPESKDPGILEKRYEKALTTLWKLSKSLHPSKHN